MKNTNLFVAFNENKTKALILKILHQMQDIAL